VATYYDKREGREKPIPDCSKHGLTWNPTSQRCEKITGLGFLMAEDFYIDDYGGSYYDGGSGADLYLNGGGYTPGIDYAPIDYALYEPMPLEPPSFEPLPEPSFSSGNYFEDYLDLYLELGYDPLTAVDLAAQDAQQVSIVAETTYAPAPLPDVSLPTIPYITSYVPTFWEGFPEGDYFELPPPPKLGPCNTETGLPGPCAGGFYHPQYDPCACIPFPPALAPTRTPQQQQQPQTPRPPTQQTPRPPAQPQTCPVTHCKHPTTGQCIPIPQGYTRHPQTQVCTAQPGQVSPLPIPTEAKDMFENLKELPWWVWVAGAGLLLLSQGGERTTTVRYRRAS